MQDMQLTGSLKMNHTEYADMPKSVFGLQVIRTTDPSADHRLAVTAVAQEVKDRAQEAATTTLTNALFTVTYDKAQTAFAVVAPDEITGYFKTNAAAMGEFLVRSDLCVYKVTITDYDPNFKALRNTSIFWVQSNLVGRVSWRDRENYPDERVDDDRLARWGWAGEWSSRSVPVTT